MLPAHPRLAPRLASHQSQDLAGKKPLGSFPVRVGYEAAKPGFAVERPGIPLPRMEGFAVAETIENLYPRWRHHWQVVRTSSMVPTWWTRTMTLYRVTVHILEGTAETPLGHAEKQL